MTYYASNTGPFISLEKLSGGYDLLRMLHIHLIIPPQVLEELTDGASTAIDYLHHFGIEDLVTVKIPPEPDYILEELDYGEPQLSPHFLQAAKASENTLFCCNTSSNRFMRGTSRNSGIFGIRP